MEIQPELLAPCGLYCGVCRMYHATQEHDRAFLERFMKFFGRWFPGRVLTGPDDLLCDGCLSDRLSISCRECSIRACTRQKVIQGCHECSDFPCHLIDEFPVPTGKQVILRAVPYRRTHGTEAWVQAEKKRYACPACGHRLFRGSQQCPGCQSPVDVDG